MKFFFYRSPYRSFIETAKISLMGYLFDLHLNMETSHIITREKLEFLWGTKKKAQIDALDYQPSSLSALKKIFGLLPPGWEKRDFYDLGAGKGRVMAYALLRGATKVIGVEFAANLLGALRKNMQHFPPHKVDIIEGTFEDFKITSTHPLLFLFNPCKTKTLKLTLENLVQHDPLIKKQMLIVYLNPIRSYLFEIMGFECVFFYRAPNPNDSFKFFQWK